MLDFNQLANQWKTQFSLLNNSSEIGDALKAEKDKLTRDMRTNQPALHWCETYTALVDIVISRLFDIAVKSAIEESVTPITEEPKVAVIATGGYGRKHLSPHSDLDLTFAPYQDGDPLIDKITRRMFRSLMDAVLTRAKVTVGYAYRLAEDLPELDAKTRTGLIDMRFLAGSLEQYVAFHQLYWQYFNKADFIFEKFEERKLRYQKYGDTALRAEPNLKEGAGGLRDFHFAWWIAKAYCNGNAEPFERLFEMGMINRKDVEALDKGLEVNTLLRNHLHRLTGTLRDSLVRTRQEELAIELGFVSVDEKSPAEPMMRLFYSAGHQLNLVSSNIEAIIIRSPLDLGDGLYSREGRVFANNEVQNLPMTRLRACALCRDYNLGLDSSLKTSDLDTEENIDTWALGRMMRDIFSKSGKVSRAARLMSECGVLDWVLPEFEAIRALIPYDVSHEFTVGEHSLRAIEFLDNLLLDEQAGNRLFSEVFRLITRPYLLYLAALLHDAGKGDHSRHHSEIGAEIAEAVGARWHWESKSVRDLQWLIANHLMMAETARQRDLTLESTIREFTDVVNEPDKLQMLFLLTYADTNAVGEQVWTPVQSHFMQDLYRRAMSRLSHEEEFIEDVSRMRRRLIKEYSRQSAETEHLAEHINAMPANYLMNVSREQLALHAAYTDRALLGNPVVDFAHPPNSDYTEITVITLDDPEPGLLSKITGVLYAMDLNVHTARVFTRKGEQPIALDTIWADYRGRQLSPAQCQALKKALEQVLTGEQTVSDLMVKHGKNPDALQVSYKVKVNPSESDRMAVVDIQTPPGRGVLYRISKALSSLRWDIHSARLGIWAGRAVTTFYVTDSGDGVITSDEAKLILSLLPSIDLPSSMK